MFNYMNTEIYKSGNILPDKLRNGNFYIHLIDENTANLYIGDYDENPKFLYNIKNVPVDIPPYPVCPTIPDTENFSKYCSYNLNYPINTIETINTAKVINGKCILKNITLRSNIIQPEGEWALNFKIGNAIFASVNNTEFSTIDKQISILNNAIYLLKIGDIISINIAYGGISDDQLDIDILYIYEYVDNKYSYLQYLQNYEPAIEFSINIDSYTNVIVNGYINNGFSYKIITDDNREFYSTNGNPIGIDFEYTGVLRTFKLIGDTNSMYGFSVNMPANANKYIKTMNINKSYSNMSVINLVGAALDALNIPNTLINLGNITICGKVNDVNIPTNLANLNNLDILLSELYGDGLPISSDITDNLLIAYDNIERLSIENGYVRILKGFEPKFSPSSAPTELGDIAITSIINKGGIPIVDTK